MNIRNDYEKAVDSVLQVSLRGCHSGWVLRAGFHNATYSCQNTVERPPAGVYCQYSNPAESCTYNMLASLANLQSSSLIAACIPHMQLVGSTTGSTQGTALTALSVHDMSYLCDGVIVQVELAELRHACCNMGSDVGLLLLLLLGFAGAVRCACAICSPMLIQLLPV